MISQTALAESSLYLEKDKPAPYSGILMPEDSVRTLKQAAQERDGFKLLNESLNKSVDIYKQNDKLYVDKVNILTQRNDDLAKTLESTRNTSDWTKILWFTLGVVGTGLAIRGAQTLTK